MFLYEIIVLVLIVAADIASKYAVVSALGVSNGVAERTITVIKGVLEFRYSENTGGAWSMLSDNTVLLTVFSAICSVVLIVYLFFIKKESKLLRLGIVFFAAGGLGNVYDRIVFGYVRDFISTVFMDFPIFNVADSFITVGAALVIISLVISLINEGKAEKFKEQTENFGENTAEKTSDSEGND